MPPKPKLFKSTGKTHCPQGSSQCGSMPLTAEQEQQFQVELYWCIQQLQSALTSGKLTNKQVQEHTKALNTLMNNTSSMVQKRQVMRLSFGNYREKIAAAEEKASKNITTIKVTPAKPNKKSIFVKKSVALTNGTHNFKFNFSLHPENDEIMSDEDEVPSTQEETNKKTQHTLHFVPSDNNFRFNFKTDETIS